MIAVIFTAIILNSYPMEIQRPGYLLREWRATDCTSLARYANNINIWRNVRDRFPHPYTEEDGRFFIGNIVPQSPGYESVSYTHLDVYKRQPAEPLCQVFQRERDFRHAGIRQRSDGTA